MLDRSSIVNTKIPSLFGGRRKVICAELAELLVSPRIGDSAVAE